MLRIADGRGRKTPAQIDDPTILPEIAEALDEIGYTKPAVRRQRYRRADISVSHPL